MILKIISSIDLSLKITENEEKKYVQKLQKI